MKTKARIQFLKEELKRVRELKSINVSQQLFQVASSYKTREEEILKKLKALENKETND
ncbi:MAG TPA: hypothetical protein VFD78_01900 [Chitinophagaceae bacterium]|nr:hypothetical protein [Chitinophagaceae bacterium]